MEKVVLLESSFGSWKYWKFYNFIQLLSYTK
jgi:hypothetical protein